MQKVALSNTVVAAVASTETPGTPGYFTDGVPPGTGPTEIGADWFNAVQTELLGVVTRAGLTPDATGTFSEQVADVVQGAMAVATVLDADNLSAASSRTTKGAVASALVSIDSTSVQTAAVASAAILATGGTRAAAVGSVKVDFSGGHNAAALAAGALNTSADLCDGTNVALIACADSTDAVQVENHGTRAAVIACDRAVIGSSATDAAVVASRSSGVSGTTARAAVIACKESTNSIGDTATIASDTSDGNAWASISSSADPNCAAIASTSCTASGGSGQTAVIACDNSTVAGSFSGAAIASSHSAVAGSGGLQVLLASSFARLGSVLSGNCVAGGVAAGPLPGGTDDANLMWKLNSTTGDITGAGTVATGDPNADYAEMFENAAPGVIPVGSLVARTGKTVRLAGVGDRVLGVVSATPAALANAADLGWSGRHVRDDWGVPVLKDGLRVDASGFDPGKPYTSRRARPESWTAVGLLGQLLVRVDASVTVDCDVVAGAGGVGKAGTHKRGAAVECMEIASAFDAARGYAIALCLVR